MCNNKKLTKIETKTKNGDTLKSNRFISAHSETSLLLFEVSQYLLVYPWILLVYLNIHPFVQTQDAIYSLPVLSTQQLCEVDDD